MKTKTILFIAGMTILFMSSCEKEAVIHSIEGTYIGTLAQKTTLKSANDNVQNTVDNLKSATAEVSSSGTDEIEIHCFNADFDTTFVMNYYSDNDSTFVCFTGNQFQQMYGHMRGAGHMGGMMSDQTEGETEWMHHLNDEHQAGDQHFGGFDMNTHSFGYMFQMKNSDGTYFLQFQGSKK